MKVKPESEMDVRDQLILRLERENKLQSKIIKEQENMIHELESHSSELRSILDEILTS